MVHTILKVFRVQGGEYIEEVCSRRTFILWILIRKVRLEISILLEHGVDVPDAQLVIMWDLDEGHVRLPQQLLLARKDILEEILVHYPIIREIILHYIWKMISAFISNMRMNKAYPNKRCIILAAEQSLCYRCYIEVHDRLNTRKRLRDLRCCSRYTIRSYLLLNLWANS